MKNDILVILGVNFSKFAYFWAPLGAWTGFRGQFEYFNERMQKESPRGSRNDRFAHSPNFNLEVEKNDENDDFSDFKFESRFEAGEPPGSFWGIPGIKKWLVEHIS